jgi:hypothetical protein
MDDMNERELWLCSECGHVVKDSDEFCMACESIFAETNLAARSRFGRRVDDGGVVIKPSYSHEIGYAFA